MHLLNINPSLKQQWCSLQTCSHTCPLCGVGWAPAEVCLIGLWQSEMLNKNFCPLKWQPAGYAPNSICVVARSQTIIHAAHCRQYYALPGKQHPPRNSLVPQQTKSYTLHCLLGLMLALPMPQKLPPPHILWCWRLMGLHLQRERETHCLVHALLSTLYNKTALLTMQALCWSNISLLLCSLLETSSFTLSLM